VLNLAPKNSLTLDDIRVVVRRSGFTPKEATLTVTGTLARRDKDLVLVIGDQTEHPLAAVGSAREKWAALQEFKDGQRIRIQGRVAEHASAPARIEVLEFSLLGIEGKSG
jgi:hypothetical protein